MRESSLDHLLVLLFRAFAGSSSSFSLDRPSMSFLSSGQSRLFRSRREGDSNGPTLRDRPFPGSSRTAQRMRLLRLLSNLLRLGGAAAASPPLSPPSPAGVRPSQGVTRSGFKTVRSALSDRGEDKSQKEEINRFFSALSEL